jgi:hypothetical protein
MQLANLKDTEADLETTDHLTKDMIAGAIPDKRFRKYITDDLVEMINSESDSEMRRVFRDNVLSYSSVLSTGKYSLAAYINAIKFVSYRLMGDVASVAYSKVFPDRYQALINKSASSSQIASFADNYGKNALITKIMEQTMVPTHILNAGIFQEAINVQVELMRGARSETVRQKAAESLITNLKAPEAAKIDIDITYSNDIVDDLKNTTRRLAQQQMKMIMGGQTSAKEVAHSDIMAVKQPEDIVETTYKDVTDE